MVIPLGYLRAVPIIIGRTLFNCWRARGPHAFNIIISTLWHSGPEFNYNLKLLDRG